MTPFIFGAGTDTPTYKDLQRRRAIVEALNEQATSRTPRNVGEGIAAIGNALAGYMANKAVGKKEDAERERVSGIYDALVGNGQGGFSGGVPTGGSARDAIASIESAGSGDYSARGPVTKSGDRAYGRYQVMGANIPDWSKEALGVALTPEQFLVDPKAQDAVFDHRFGGYTAKYGPEGAARAWFSGEGGMNNPNASDGNLTNDQYAARFNSAMGGMGGMSSAVEAMNPTQMSQLAELAANPYLDDGKRMVVQALLQQSIAGMAPQQPMTPYQQAQLALDRDRLDFDRDKFAAGTREGPKFYGTAQWADRTPDDDDPTLSPYQIGTDGSVNWLDLSGAQPQPPTRNVDLGTTQAQVGPGGGVQNTLEKDVAGAAAQTDIGKANAAAAAGLGEQELLVNSAIEQIDRIVNDPALPSVLGNIQGRMVPMTQAGANVVAQIDGLGGKVFASAINALRGLGAMSEREGDAAKQSLANLSRIQDEKVYAAELKRLGDMLKAKLEVARQKAAAVQAQPAMPNDPDAAIFEKYGLQ